MSWDNDMRHRYHTRRAMTISPQNSEDNVNISLSYERTLDAGLGHDF